MAAVGDYTETTPLPALECPPARQVVSGVYQGIVPGTRRCGQLRAAPLVPELPKFLRETWDNSWQRRHSSPQLTERDMVVGAVPGPQVDGLLWTAPQRLGQKLQEVLPDGSTRTPGLVGRRG